jgi:hypothetical protein
MTQFTCKLYVCVCVLIYVVCVCSLMCVCVCAYLCGVCVCLFMWCACVLIYVVCVLIYVGLVWSCRCTRIQKHTLTHTYTFSHEKHIYTYLHLLTRIYT